MKGSSCIGSLCATAVLCAACGGMTRAPDERSSPANAAAGSTTGLESSTSMETIGDSQTGEAGCTSEVRLDPVIEAYVRRMYGPKEGPIDGEALREVGSLILSEAASSLAGVECMVNLQTLELVPGSVDSITPLTGLRRLVTVGFTGNKVSNLTPLNDKPELTRISAIENAVEDLEGLELPAGECPRFWLTDNPLRESALAAIERFCSDGWYVLYENGGDSTACNPQCLPRF